MIKILIIPIIIGVLALSLEKKAGAKILCIIKKGNPIASTERLYAVICTSLHENSPLLKIVPTIGSENIANPTADGAPKKITKRNPWLRDAEYSWTLSATYDLDSEGSNTVPIAIAKTPKGSCINLSDKYSHVGLPIGKNDEKIESTTKFTCSKEPTTREGKRSEKNLFRPSALRLRLGLRLIFKLRSEGI